MMIGQTFLKRFRVERLLCEGGMGQIYVARQLDQDREVVVKVLKERVASQPVVRERFRREIQVLGQFQHPYVVEFYGGSVGPGAMFLVMEYVRGTALDRLLGQSGRLSPERVGSVLAQLCDVLQAAHDQSIVHCDLKPANLMIVHPGTAYESIKLMDFGVAKMPTLLSLSALDMQAGELMSGTLQYMSPEQARAEDLDHRADLYSVGVMLYQMLSGRLPFERSSASALLAAHKNEVPPSFAQCGPAIAVPRPIEAVVQNCLAKHREQRPQNATELARLYEKALGRKIVLPPGRSAHRASSLLPGGGNGQGDGPISPAKLPATAPAPRAALDPNAAAYELHVCIPESLAMLKLRGFVQDLGGRLVDPDAAPSPGVIRVRLAAGGQPASFSSPTGLASSSSADRNVKAASQGQVIDMELRIQRADPNQPNHLTIILTLRAKNTWSVSRKELKGRYDKIHGDLKAYLQAIS
jgi:tRNA A-37 threonylcarbamoyl transferase component Bud32